MSEDPSARRSDRRRRATTIAGAVGAVWAWQAAFGLLATWPAVSLVRAAFAGDPQGDARLWPGGAHALLAFLSRDADGVRAAIDGGALILIAGAVFGLVPMGALMIAVAPNSPERRRVRLSFAVWRSLRFFPVLAILLVVFGLSEVGALGAGVVVGRFVAGAVHDGLGEARSEQLGAAVGMIFVALAAVIGVVHDLARAAAVRLHAGAMHAVGAAVRAMYVNATSLTWSWAWREIASFLPVFAGAALATRLGSDGGATFALLALVHQAIAIIRVAFRASWLATALRSIKATP